MTKQYWGFHKETLIVNQTPVEARVVAEQALIPKTALKVKPLPDKEGFQVCVVLDENKCAVGSEYIEDHRGKTVYNKQAPAQSKVVTQLGAIEEGWTLKVSPTPYHTFSESLDDWELTPEAAQKQLSDALKASKSDIDSTAADISNRWTRFAEEYEKREAQALAFKGAGYTGECGDYITMFSKRAGLTTTEATDLILLQAETLRTLQAQLASERMRKYELDACATVESIQLLAQEICTNLTAIGESHE